MHKPYRLNLTKDKEALPKILESHINREEARLSYRRTIWMLAALYMGGHRHFNVLDIDRNHIDSQFIDEEGKLAYHSSDLLAAANDISGRLQSADYRPAVSTRFTSLQGTRDRAVAQVLMDSMVSENALKEKVERFAWDMTYLGCSGISGHLVDHPVVGLTSDIEVISPVELFPFPSLLYDLNQQRGLVRQRWLPFDNLRAKFPNKQFGPQTQAKMELRRIKSGDIVDPTSHDLGIKTHGGGGYDNKNQPQTTRYAQVRELWLVGERDICYRYIVTCGDALLLDEEYDGEVYCPISVCRFLNNGTFHGAGTFDLLWHIHRQKEILSKTLFNNANDLDRFGFLVVPQSSMNTNPVIREVGRSLKILPWEPDMLGSGFNPFAVQPTTTSDFPGRVASVAQQDFDRLNPISDLVQEKGRLENASGLRFLDELDRRKTVVSSMNADRAWGNMWRGLAHRAVNYAASTDRPIPVTRLTLDLVGALIDPVENTVQFGDNPVPDIARLDFSVRDISPSSPSVKKAELFQVYTQLPSFSEDSDGLIIHCLANGIELEAYLGDYEGAYETIVRDIILLYGDGTNPTNRVIPTQYTMKPSFQLRILSNFQSTIQMRQASPAIQDAFANYTDALRRAAGFMLPAGIPNPDELAIATQSPTAQSPTPLGGGGPLPFPAAAG